MSGDVKLKAALPKDFEANGLAGESWREHFDESNKPVVAIVVLQTDEVTEKRASRTRIPKVTITRIEAISDDVEAGELIQRMQVLAEERNGVTSLDIPPTPPSTSSNVLDFKDGKGAAK